MGMWGTVQKPGWGLIRSRGRIGSAGDTKNKYEEAGLNRPLKVTAHHVPG